MRQVTEFEDGFLRAESYTAGDPAEIATGDFDLVLAVGSWDRRCMCLMNGRVRGAHGMLVLFSTRDSEGLRDTHDAALKALLGGICESMEVVEDDSLNLQGLWAKILAVVVSRRRHVGRPLRVFLDMSTCPRYYTLAILANTLGKGLASEISLFYSEGVYPAPEEGTIERIEVFTRGRWKEVPVPGLTGDWAPWKKQCYFASIGFEGSKTLRTISGADPDRVEILAPYPGVRPEYARRTLQNNRELFQQFGVNSRRILRAPAGDAVAAWRVLSEADRERLEEENTYFTCCGTKPHAVAMGLRAMVTKAPAVLYNLPDGHNVVRIEPAGVFWRFNIADLTAL